MDKKTTGFIIGGAVTGAILGYILSRVGTDKIMDILKDKNIISPEITRVIDDFKSGFKSK